MRKPKIAVIGAGPAGIATSIQLRRLGYEPQLFEKEIAGGLLWNANLIENYPGFPEGISGPDLINLMIKHLKKLDIEIINLEIDNLFLEDNLFHLQSDKNKYRADFVVIASGTKPRPYSVKISDTIKKNIHQDIRNILDVNGKHIVIIGAGDAAFDHALNLSRNNKVSIINHGTRIRSLQLLVDRVFTNQRITYTDNTIVESIDLWENKDNKNLIRVNCITQNKNKLCIICDEVVFAIGREPQLDFIDQSVEDDGILFAGDVKNGIYRQASIAVGEGIRAAMKIHNKILMR